MGSYKFIAKEDSVIIQLSGKLDIYFAEELNEALSKELIKEKKYSIEFLKIEEISLPILQMILSIQKSQFNVNVDFSALSDDIKQQVLVCGLEESNFNLK